MAKLKMFSVYDVKVGAYLQPFFMRSSGEAVRGWESAVNDPKTGFYSHPVDYTLFELGDYDEESGVVCMHPGKIPLGCAVEFKKTVSDADRQLSLPAGVSHINSA